MPTTASAPWARNASAPAVTWLAVGFPHTELKTSACSPAASRSRTNSAMKGSAATPLSVTTSGRVAPVEVRCALTFFRAPAPNVIAVGNENLCRLMMAQQTRQELTTDEHGWLTYRIPLVAANASEWFL